ncbi:MAG: ribonuclease H family protein [Bacteroidales bacterium]|nr:ribonuclease H family protein [Bacteroidales bacterium]
MAKNRFYVVWSGRNPGIYSDWEVCKREIMGCKGAKYKGFPDRLSAEKAFKDGPDAYWGKDVAPIIDLAAAKERPVSPCITVDAACSGNPGKMEYQGVFVDFATQPATRRDLFKSPVFPNATNNIGEFLALVHALALQKKNGWKYPIYSDSVNAQIWVRQKKCKTKLQPNAKNEQLFELVARAEKWLNENAIEVPIFKWKTEIWGEIPADYGRK